MSIHHVFVIINLFIIITHLPKVLDFMNKKYGPYEEVEYPQVDIFILLIAVTSCGVNYGKIIF